MVLCDVVMLILCFGGFRFAFCEASLRKSCFSMIIFVVNFVVLLWVFCILWWIVVVFVSLFMRLFILMKLFCVFVVFFLNVVLDVCAISTRRRSVVSRIFFIVVIFLGSMLEIFNVFMRMYVGILKDVCLSE